MISILDESFPKDAKPKLTYPQWFYVNFPPLGSTTEAATKWLANLLETKEMVALKKQYQVLETKRFHKLIDSEGGAHALLGQCLELLQLINDFRFP